MQLKALGKHSKFGSEMRLFLSSLIYLETWTQNMTVKIWKYRRSVVPEASRTSGRPSGRPVRRPVGLPVVRLGGQSAGPQAGRLSNGPTGQLFTPGKTAKTRYVTDTSNRPRSTGRPWSGRPVVRSTRQPWVYIQALVLGSRQIMPTHRSPIGHCCRNAVVRV